MITLSKIALAGATALVGVAALCLPCDPAAASPGALSAASIGHGVAAPSPVQLDTATAHLAVQGMTCGSCPTTARLALKSDEGVYSARVSFDSASAVVLYDPAKTTPEEFIARLERMTGFRARLLDRPGAQPEPLDPVSLVPEEAAHSTAFEGARGSSAG